MWFEVFQILDPPLFENIKEVEAEPWMRVLDKGENVGAERVSIDPKSQMLVERHPHSANQCKSLEPNWKPTWNAEQDSLSAT